MRRSAAAIRRSAGGLRGFATSPTPTITGVAVYQCDLPLKEGTYNWSGGKSVSVFDSTVVEVRTSDPAITGYGEYCALGPFYLPAYAEGARTGIAILAPALIGCEATSITRANEVMDATLKGHPYTKSALDMALWDILGKVTGAPVSTLLGGATKEPIDLYRAISLDDPIVMAKSVSKYKEEGYRKFQLKLGGGGVDVDVARIRKCSKAAGSGCILIGDANTGWKQHEAQRIVRAVSDIDVYIEQPCLTYDECLNVRNNTDHPFVMDECVDDIHSLVRAHGDSACDVVNLKISKFGGITKTRVARDLCTELGLAMTIEDCWGGDITTAAIVHLAQSTRADMRFTVTDFNSYNTVCNADGSPQRVDGRVVASDAPGLGVTPRFDVMTKVAEFGS